MSTTCECYSNTFLYFYYKANTDDDIVFDEFRGKINETITAVKCLPSIHCFFVSFSPFLLPSILIQPFSLDNSFFFTTNFANCSKRLG